jgi:parallel beta-helix repeat protein
MKKFAVLIFFALFSGGLAQANDIYLAQNSAGAGDGSACGNAKAVSFFNSSGNWGTGSAQIGPGTTVHLCGTISGAAGATALTVSGNGSSGSPVTVVFEPGAVLTAPYWGLSGAINITNHNYITVDGGSNGIIKNTANGSGMAYHVGSRGISATASSNVTIKNLTVSNICVHSSTSDTAGCQTSGNQADAIYVYGGSNNTVTGNTIDDAHWAIFAPFPGSATTSNLNISNNTMYNVDHGVAVGDGNSGATLSGLVISGNTFHDMVNWDDVNDSFHHDYIHIFTFSGSSKITGLQIFNNYFHGDPGQNNTAFIYIESPSGNSISGALIYNNVLTNSSSTHLTPYGYISSSGTGNTNQSLYNNTIVGSSTSQGMANECFFLGGSGYKVMNNSCQNVGLFLVVNGGASIASMNRNNWYNGGGFYVNNGYLSFTAWKALCLCDANSISSNPNLDSNFKPLSTSPLLKAASNLYSLGVSNLNMDKALQPRSSSSTTNWDIGAYSYGSASTGTAPNAPTGLSASVQ